MSLPQDAKIQILSKLCADFANCARNSPNGVNKNTFEYCITSSKEDSSIKQMARFASLKEMNKPIIKIAFDTRRINQEIDRNPRKNAQTYVRSEPYIDDESQEKIQVFAKLFKVQKNIKSQYETDDEYKDSYARQLYDLLHEILRIGQKDFDIFKPKLAFLEQLLFNRYRLSMEQLKTMSEKQIQKIVLAKDEGLSGKKEYLKEVSGNMETTSMVKDSNGKSTQESIVNALFGTPVRKEGEKTVERIITIKITENVVE